MNSLLLVMVGGAFGAGAPWGTLAVNLTGGFLMGLLAGWLALRGDGANARLLLGVGVLGGFTTFSAFSLDVVLMLQRGEYWSATAYVAASVLGSVVALMAGLSLVRVAA